MTWTFTLPIDLPSANRHGGAATNARHAANAAMYRRQRATWVAMLKAEARRVGLPSMNGWRDVLDRGGAHVRAVEIVRLWGKGCRAWDDDNLVAAAKGLRDAMQVERVIGRAGSVPRLIAGAGIVWDDSAKWSAWTYGQERAEDGKAAVRVTVSEERP